ncbi:MAG: T9SS type A sorting domain-containing protein [bacterium]|nr:T9SS type A sorting domain-containing protein [bacterium]
MRRFLYISLLFLLAVPSAIGQDTRIIWQKSIGGVGYDRINDILTDESGDAFVLSTVQVANNHEIQVSKITEGGDFLWTKTIGGERDDRGQKLLLDANGDLLILGTSNSLDILGQTSHGSLDIVVIRMSVTGDVLDADIYGGSKFEEAASILQKPNGNYIVTGTTLSEDFNVSVNNGQADAWLFEIDQYGTLLWEKTLGGSDDEWAVMTKLIADGSLITISSSSTYQGDYSENHGDADVALYHTSGEGYLNWKRLYGGFMADYPADIEFLPNGHFLVGANTFSSGGDVPNNNGGQDALLMEIDQTGELISAQTYGAFGNDRIAALEPKGDGFVIFGSSSSASINAAVGNGEQDFWMYEINNEKEVVDQYLFGASGFDEGVTFSLGKDGSVIMGGESNSDDGVIGTNMGKNDGWLLKVKSNLNTTHKQASVHPNPSNGIVYINELEENAELSLIDLQGTPIINAITPYGKSRILDVSMQPSGVYILQVVYPDRKEVHRIVRN